MKKGLTTVKASINSKKMDKDFEQHQTMLKMTSKSFYTPRGIGHRNITNLVRLFNQYTNYLNYLNINEL